MYKEIYQICNNMIQALFVPMALQILFNELKDKGSWLKKHR